MFTYLLSNLLKHRQGHLQGRRGGHQQGGDKGNLNQEAKTEKRIDAADGDFSSETPIETHGQQPRRSTRQKLRDPDPLEINLV